MTFLTAQRADLSALAAHDRLRRLQPRTGVDFSSNDYLALAHAPRLRAAAVDALSRGVGLGSGGSRLLRGNDPEHETLEQEAARFFGSESALFFSTGYAANAALLSTLPQTGDLIVHDALIHASAHEGMRLARADRASTPHNDVDAIADTIAAWRRGGATGQAWIAVESLYSMDGDRAPLADLVALADRLGAMLLIDEAHATGVFGAQGRGLAAGLDGRENVITLRTCGKALGCEGALLCAPGIVRDMLVNRGRAFIFSTAPSPLIAAVVRESLHILADEPGRRDALQRLIDHAGRVLAPHGVVATGSQIMPLVLGDDARTMRIAAAMQAAGFDVRGVRPPTVPAGTSRLRISLTLNVGTDEIDALGIALGDALR
jgi:8-amino-7-oxononanoate synthase